MKKIYILIPVVVIIVLGFIFYLMQKKDSGSTPEQTETQTALTVKTISGQKSENKRSNLSTIFSGDAVKNWGFAVIESKMFYVNSSFAIMRYDMANGSEKNLYQSKAKVNSVRILSNSSTALIQFFKDDGIDSFFLKTDTIRPLAVKATAQAEKTMLGYVIPENDQILLINNSGDLEKKIANTNDEILKLSYSENQSCNLKSSDRESMKSKLSCLDKADKGFSTNITGAVDLLNNDQAVLVTYAEDGSGKGVLYDKSGNALTRLNNIDVDKSVATSEGFYIVSKPVDFDSIEIKHNGVGFIANSGELSTIVDSSATDDFAISAIAFSKNHLYMQEGSKIWKLTTNK